MDESERIIAAYLYCKRGCSQKRVARLMNHTDAHVNKLLNNENPYWVETREFLPDGIDSGLLEQIERDHSKGLEALRDRLKSHNSKQTDWTIRIVDSGPFSSTGDEEIGLGHFSLGAAEALAELLPTMTSVGVSWGKTVFHVCERLCKIASMTKRRQQVAKSNICFVPTSGEPLNQPNVRILSSNIVAGLQKTFTGNDDALSLGAAAAYIPGRCLGLAEQTIRDFFNAIDGYRKVFTGDNGNPPLINKIDTFIMSVGSSDVGPKANPILEAAREVVNISSEDMKRISLGDVAGCFLPRPNLSADDQGLIDRINAKWTGITQQQILDCAERARKDGYRPGVVLLAAGPSKAEVVNYCIDHKLVNKLIIDDAIANYLSEQYI